MRNRFARFVLAAAVLLVAGAGLPARAAGLVDLEISMTDAPDPVGIGATLTYSVQIANRGPDPATNVTFSDSLPGGVSFRSSGASQGSCAGTTYVSCDLGTIPAGGGATVTVTVEPTRPGIITNSVYVYGNENETDYFDNDAAVDTEVLGPDLTLAMTDSPDPVGTGDTLRYTITVTNEGRDRATNVQLSDSLPGGVTFLSATATQGSCSGTSYISCSLGTIPAGGYVDVLIDVNPFYATVLTNSAYVYAAEQETDFNDNSVSENTVVNGPDLSLTMTDAPDPVLAGQALTYTLNVSNIGQGGASDVYLYDSLPPGVTFVSASSTLGSCSGIVSCSIGALGAGAQAHITIVVVPNDAGTITNSASVSSSESDDFSNNQASATTTVRPSADLGIRLSDAPDPTLTGRVLTYTVDIGNAGPSAATGTVLTVDLPAGVAIESVSPGCGAGDPVTCSLGTLFPSGFDSVTIQVVPSAPGTLTATASIRSDLPDPDTSDNSAVATTLVRADRDLDGIADELDNCPDLANPDQSNADGDSFGDACDPDDDNDGLTDADEIRRGTDPRNPDSDSDRLSDGEEVNQYGTNPRLADTDGDDLGDGDEVFVYGTDPLDPDSDGDLIGDGTEIDGRSDPWNPFSLSTPLGPVTLLDPPPFEENPVTDPLPPLP